jgi:hypothetical protein
MRTNYVTFTSPMVVCHARHLGPVLWIRVAASDIRRKNNCTDYEMDRGTLKEQMYEAVPTVVLVENGQEVRRFTGARSHINIVMQFHQWVVLDQQKYLTVIQLVFVNGGPKELIVSFFMDMGYHSKYGLKVNLMNEIGFGILVMPRDHYIK